MAIDYLSIEKRKAAKIAKELRYGSEVIRRIKQAKTSYEIGRILKQARLDRE